MVPVIAAATSAGWKENETPTPEQVEAAARALHELDVSDHERARLDEPEWEQHREEYERTVGAALAAASGEASDTALSSWVYCAQHLTPHASGWCTVSNQQKLRLNAITRDEAYTEAKQLGLRFANDPPPASY
jgi:hypothetical protein